LTIRTAPNAAGSLYYQQLTMDADHIVIVGFTWFSVGQANKQNEPILAKQIGVFLAKKS
jgi:hypothetical protein